MTKTIGVFKKIIGLEIEVGVTRGGKSAVVNINITGPFGVSIKKQIDPKAAGEFAALLVVARDEAEKT